MTPRTCLTIAGSDSGGGAGIQADLKTFAALGVFGASAVTAITAQNTMGVTAVHVVPTDLVEAQVRVVISDLHPASVKTGMLAEREIITRVSELAAEGLLPALVIDPVLISTSGDALLGPGGVEAYRDLLFPFASVLTPNLPEAAALLDCAPSSLASLDAMVDAATTLHELGPTVVVVKGGHLARLGARRSTSQANDEKSPDVIAGPDGVDVLWSPRIRTGNDHGTGCTLSAAIAANLALGLDTHTAITRAKDFVTRALEGSARWHLGAGHGPLDHFGWSAEQAMGSTNDAASSDADPSESGK